MNKTISWVVGGIALVLVGFAFGYAVFHKSAPQLAGAVGDTYSAPNFISAQIDGTGATYGYVSADNKWIWGGFCNTSGRDRFVNSLEYGGVGLGTVSTSTTANIGLTLATTTALASGLAGNTNYISNGNVLGTSTAGYYYQNATSTPTGSVSSFATGVTRVWANNSCIVVESPATTSASVWVRINYFAQ